MPYSQSAPWLPLGLAILTSSLASAVHAATLEPPPETAASEQIRIAQITPDATLGAEASVVTPDVPINGDSADQIEGGAVRGDNLFHSFQEFNVNTGQRVYFANPSGIENILGRVTGSNLSDIDGLLGVNGGANLFLLNPNGIIFGPNAELDIRGSFLASTGDSFAFADGSEFSAVNPQARALLTMSVPLGVQYGANPGSIMNQGDLSVVQDLTLAAGNVTHTGTLVTDFGDLVIEGVAGDVVLQGDTTSTVGDTTIQASNQVEARNSVLSAGRQLTVRGNDVEVQSVDAHTALLSANSDLQLNGGQLETKGNLTLQATEDVQLQDTEGQPFVASAGMDLILQAGQSINTLDLSHPDSQLSASRDLVLRAPSWQLGNRLDPDNALYTVGSYFRTEQLDGRVVDLWVPYDNAQVVRANADVEFTQNYNGPSLYVLAGGQVTAGETVDTININAPERGRVTATLSNGQAVTLQSSHRGTLDIRAGVEADRFLGDALSSTNLPLVNAAVPGIEPMGEPTGADITLGEVESTGDQQGVAITNLGGGWF